MKEPRHKYCLLWPFLSLSEPDTIAFALDFNPETFELWSTKFSITCFRRQEKCCNCAAIQKNLFIRQTLTKVLFILSVVLKFECLDDFLCCHHSNETSSAVLSHGILFIQYGILILDCVDEILQWYHNFFAVLSHGIIH